MTSSMSAVMVMAKKDKPDLQTGFYDEKCWSNISRPEGIWAYAKGRTLAEKAAWDFQQSLPKEERFELVTICPSMVVGPALVRGGFAGFAIPRFFDGS